MLEPHRSTLEKCVYCPKLSRASCPVSNVEGNETVTPWGKMSTAYFLGRGDMPIDRTHAEPAWACTSCFACRERCDHRNEVATVLNDARAELFTRGAAPIAAREAAARWAARSAESAAAIDAIVRNEGEDVGADAVRLLVGCGYARHAPDVASDAVRATRALTGRAVRPVRNCCGLPLLYAGDLAGFTRAARAVADEVAGGGRLIAVDPGCARALLVEYARVGVAVEKPELFIDVAASSLDKLEALDPAAGAQRRVRYHDPCQLGRGLGKFEEPRNVLARITGAPPEEFIRSRTNADCSGAGGLVPVTRPASSKAMGDARVEEHRALGGGLLVTACAQSLRRFRSSGEPAEDIVQLIARSTSAAAK